MATQISRAAPYQTESSYYTRVVREKFQLNEASAPVKQQDFAKIDFLPRLDDYLSRSAKRILNGGLETQVPVGWPVKLSGPMAWTGNDFADETRFVCHLTSLEKEEIRNALRHFKGTRSSYEPN